MGGPAFRLFYSPASLFSGPLLLLVSVKATMSGCCLVVALVCAVRAAFCLPVMALDCFFGEHATKGSRTHRRSRLFRHLATAVASDSSDDGESSAAAAVKHQQPAYRACVQCGSRGPGDEPFLLPCCNAWICVSCTAVLVDTNIVPSCPCCRTRMRITALEPVTRSAFRAVPVV